MLYFEILSAPISESAQKYKGLYRRSPCPLKNGGNSKRFMELWNRYAENYDTAMGITTELTFKEIKELAELASAELGESYEVVCFTEKNECPNSVYTYYGMDVISFGGYSMVGENIFTENERCPIKGVIHILNEYFRDKLNEYGLFGEEAYAVEFLNVLKDLNESIPCIIENESWRIVHIFSV